MTMLSKANNLLQLIEAKRLYKVLILIHIHDIKAKHIKAKSSAYNELIENCMLMKGSFEPR